MSANRPDSPQPAPRGTGTSGSATTGVGGQGKGTQLGGPLSETERKVEPTGGERPPIPTPEAPPPEPETRSSLTAYFGGEEADLAALAQDEGFGPKVVVLFDYVRGHARGRVIRASTLLNLGEDEQAFRKDERAVNFARAEMNRLLGLKAVRAATEEEAKHTQVTFVEGEPALTSALETAQATIDQLRKQLAQAQGQNPPPAGAQTGAGIGDAATL